MSKRSAAEAFAKKPLSAFAAAQAKKSSLPPLEAVIPDEIGASLEQVVESSTGEDLTLDQEDSDPTTPYRNGSIPTPTPSTATTDGLPITLSSFKASKLKTGNDGLDATLDAGEYLTCGGIYSLRVTQGAVSVYGAFLTPTSPAYDVYAPYSHALPTILARFNDSKIELRSSNCALPSLRKISPLWNRIWPEDSVQGFRMFVKSNDDSTQNVANLSIDDNIQSELNRLSNAKSSSGSPPTILVTGAKASGKSTFCRVLLNTFLTSPARHKNDTCFWLDLDPGQPEFSCGGQLSLVQIRQPLLGPAFTHPITHPALPYRTVRAHTLAANSPREDFDHYLRCAKNLMKHYFEVRGNAPLIINCPGWVAGSGADLIQSLLTGLRPSEVILLESADTLITELAQLIQNSSNKHSVTTLAARQRWLAPRPAAELRGLQTMSYHHARKSRHDTIIWTPEPLSEGALWTESYSQSDRIQGLISYYEPLPLECLVSILEYSSVAIVVVTDTRAFGSSNANGSKKPDDLSDSTAAPFKLLHSPENFPYFSSTNPLTNTISPLDPAYSHCLGQAIITNIDTAEQKVQFSTPLQSSELSKAIGAKPGNRLVFVRGRLGNPDWALLEDVYARDFRTSVNPEVLPKDFDLDESGSEDDSSEPSGGVRCRLTGAEGRPPYVAVRDAVTARAAGGLGEAVWRPRYLPRRAGG